MNDTMPGRHHRAEVTGGPEPILLAADLIQQGAPERLAAGLLRTGPVDVLVNNAGGSRPMTDPNNAAVWN